MKEPVKDPLEIRLNRLEEECAGQPQLMYEWCVALAKARKSSKEAKNSEKLMAASLSMEMRKNPFEFGLEKVTEDSVKQCILVQTAYKAQQEEVIQAEYEEDILEGFVKAIVDRREQLGNEVKLHGQAYFSKPDTGTGTTPQMREKVMQEADSNIGRKPVTGKRTK